jgi:hypothetical protein
MSELSDDIARGCLENGEPIEARWGTGEWSAQPEQQQEPDPWEEALAAAEQRGYVKALDDVYETLLLKLDPDSDVPLLDVLGVLVSMKSEYLKEEGKNDN